MRLNRVWLVIGILLIFSAFYEARLRPQSRPLYQRALALYRQDNFAESLVELERAYEIDPNSTAILVLMGWDQLKLGQYEAAGESFGRAERLDPELVEAKLGLAYLGIESGQGQVRLEEVRNLLAQEPRNMDFQLAAATMFRQAGQNREAATMFRSLLGRELYSELARRNLEQLYGMENLDEPIPADFPQINRPENLQVHFRTQGRYWQRRNGEAWENIYIRGVNLGPGLPGRYASDPPVLVEDYLSWFQQISSLGANTVRVFSILPPAFYRALRRHNETPDQTPLYLIQEVWLADSPAANLFQSQLLSSSRQEIANAIDVVHGQGDLPVRPGYGGGLYVVDVSEYLLGILIGREWEPNLVATNNTANSGHDSYQGRFVSLPQGNATEAWLAGMLDYSAQYQTLQYNEQAPVGIVNWPALDPLRHPTEASLLEEFEFRRRLGETLTPPQPGETADDNDTVSVDETRFERSSELLSGIFASYTVFPYFPDFVYREPAYLNVRDDQGPNPYLGYLRALKQYYQGMPLLAGGYGISSSLGVARFHPYGMNHGGLTEQEQGAALARMTRNLDEAGWAGGLITEWQDEWYRSSWLTSPLSLPPERRILWYNKLDPDQNLGIWTFDPSGDAQLWSSFAGWSQATPLYLKDRGPIRTLNDGWDTERTLRSLSVSSDEAFLYLRLQVGNLRENSNNLPDFGAAQYFIGINTSPGRFGSRVQPGLAPQVRSDSGANFLIHLGDGRAQLLIASNYNPRELRPISGLPANVALSYRIPFRPQVEEWSGFEEILIETNRRRFARDGRMFPPQRYSLSQLRYRAAGQTEDTLATWTADFSGNALIFRLPWPMLFVTDPSSRRVLTGTEGGPEFTTTETAGIQLFAASFRPGDPVEFSLFPLGGVPAADSLPPLDENGSFQGLRNYTWARWDSISKNGRWKAGYTALQQAFQMVGARTR